MAIGNMIEEYSGRRSAPVDVNDVLASLRTRGVKDEVYFFPVDIKDAVLRGQFVHWDEINDFEYPTDATQAVTKSVAGIFYAKSLTDDWQRLVCCKELLHILDPDQWRASTPAEVKNLTDKIVLPPEYQDGLKDGLPTVSDRIGILQAVAVLFPWAAREILIKARAADRVSALEVSRLVDLPQRYTNMVMSEYWPAMYESLLSMKD
ncbi:hypothetical protein [Phenylobacterium sp.]|uniref:hypothetical protein n=1 Tax=Phenylobacterium sp. TaxID=1871053 RepID=UPI0025D0F9A5|nr:hypothetical protein [Phenylobacterium sp.]